MAYPVLHQERDDDTLLNYLDTTLSTTLTRFISSLSERDQIIFKARFGYDAEYSTLKKAGEIVAPFNVSKEHPAGTAMTRERIRQIQEQLISKWQQFTGVNGDATWVNVTRFYDLINDDFMPGLRSHFSDVKHFNRFLLATCDKAEDELELIYQGKTSKDSLDEFWATECGSPIGLDELLSALGEHLDVPTLGLRNLVFHFLARGELQLDLESGLLSPAKLGKAVSLAHASLAYPNGTGWKVLQKHVNDQRLCTRKITEARLDFAISNAVDAGWLFQSGRGQYAPISLLSRRVGSKSIMTALQQVKKLLLALPDETSSTPLSHIYNKHKADFAGLDYYTVRYIVKQYGVLEDVYFLGLSSSDMVSLNKDIKTRPNRVLIVEEFSHGKAFTLNDVTGLLRSESRRYAVYLLDGLVKEGLVVRLARNSYVIAEAVNGDLDLKAITHFVHAALLAHKGEKVAYETLREAVETEFNVHLESESHLSSIIRANSEIFDSAWTFSENYVHLV